MKQMMKKTGFLLLLAALLAVGMAFASAEEGQETPHQHTWETVSQTAATCTTGGTVVKECTGCHDRTEQHSDPLGHNWESVNKAPTCKNEGFKGRKCTRCGVEEGETIAKLGHNYGPWVLVSDDCVDGLEVRTCSRCGLEHHNKIQGSTHTWSAWTVSVPPTATQQGEETRVCAKCGTWETRPIPTLNFVFGTEGTEGFSMEVNVTSSSVSYAEGDEVQFNWTIVNSSARNCSLSGIACRQGDEAPESSGGLDVALPANGGSLSGAANVAISPFAEGASSVTFVFQCYLTFEDGTVGYTTLAEAVVPVASAHEEEAAEPEPEAEEPAGVTEPGDVSVVKEIVSSPRNPDGYRIGETIEYRVTVTNEGGAAILDLQVSDPMADRSSAADVKGGAALLAPGEALTFTFKRTVGTEDAAEGYLANTAYASWTDPSSGETVTGASNTVIAPTRRVQKEAELSVTERLLNAPSTMLPSGVLCFVPGSVIRYEITAENVSDETVRNVEIHESLANGLLASVPVLEPDGKLTVRLEHTVTMADVAAGAVFSVASALYEDEAGAPGAAFSEGLETPAGNAVSVNSQVEITKREISSPRNGAFYQPGETVEYQIAVLNTGSAMLRTVQVMDSLARENGGVVDTVSNLRPGQENVSAFRYTVSEADAGRSALASRASAVFTAMNGTVKAVSSAPVVSALAPDGALEGEGEDRLVTAKAKETLPEGSGAVPVRLEGETESYVSCRIAASARNESVTEYSTDLCVLHAQTYSRVMQQVEAAETPMQEAAAWNAAAKAFQEDLAALYAACQDAASTSGAKTTVLSEQQLFLAQAESFRAYLELTHPDDPVLPAKTYALELIGKCAKLCYEAHCAPEMRADSYTALYEEAGGQPGAENAIYPQSGKTIGTEAQAMRLVLAAGNAQELTLAWQQGEKLWRKEMNRLLDEAYAAAGSEVDKAVVFAEQQSFCAWLDARTELLNLLYADQPAAVAEVVAREIWSRAVALSMYK